jgi:hypothetical protein
LAQGQKHNKYLLESTVIATKRGILGLKLVCGISDLFSSLLSLPVNHFNHKIANLKIVGENFQNGVRLGPHTLQ